MSARFVGFEEIVTMGARTILGGDLAIDLGTANTLVHVRGQGVVLDEPSVVAIDTRSDAVIAVGAEAKRMIGRTPPYLVTVRPLRNGVITDVVTTERMLRHFLTAVHRRSRLVRPRLVICTPSGLTGVEQRAVTETCYQAGARSVHLIEEPIAAAIGAELPVHEPVGTMVVDVGGGTTEVAILALGGIVTSRSVRVGGHDLDDALIAHVKKEYAVAMGEGTAEEVKTALGSAFPSADEPRAEIRGRDLVTGLPKTVSLPAEEVRRAISEPVSHILDTVVNTLDQCPPELAGDIVDRGITLAGGGSLLRGLDERLRHETGMPVQYCEDPLRAVVTGAGRCVDDFDDLQHVLVAEHR